LEWEPRSISLARSLPLPISHGGSLCGYEKACTRSVSPATPISRATASARARLDSVGCINISSGFNLDLGCALKDFRGWGCSPWDSSGCEAGSDMLRGDKSRDLGRLLSSMINCAVESATIIVAINPAWNVIATSM